MHAKLVKESLNENVKDVQSIPVSELSQLIKEWMPYVLNYNPQFIDADEDGGEPMDDFDRWGLVYLDIPGLREGFTVMVMDYAGQIKVKFYSDTVAFVAGEEDDEYMKWVSGVPIQTVDEEYFEEVLDRVYKYHNLDRNNPEGESDYTDDMVTM